MTAKLGERLRTKRLAKPLGLREAAGKLRISPTYLSRIETGEEKRPPTEDVLRSMAALYGDDLDQLMTLAGRVAEDVADYITGDPGLPQFLRSAQQQGYTAKDLQKLLPSTPGKRR